MKFHIFQLYFFRPGEIERPTGLAPEVKEAPEVNGDNSPASGEFYSFVSDSTINFFLNFEQQ